MHTAVVAQNLGKTYKLYGSPWSRIAELVLGGERHLKHTALHDVSFELKGGEGLGIIGENGAGKSTLLKILANIATPSGGSYQSHGRIASILELGSGFHPEFTGRQNIVLNAAMVGLSEGEVRKKTPEIIEFSELGPFIDQPVKVYSSGMAMRLGFAIATQVEPNILIIDEALSVGDGYFQKKCTDRIRTFLDEGGTLLFCSHAMYYVSAFCERALWLRHGGVEALGPTAEVVKSYEDFLLRKSRGEDPSVDSQEDGSAEQERSGPARITSVELRGGELDEESRSATSSVKTHRRYRHGEPWMVELAWTSENRSLKFHIGVAIARADEVEVVTFASHHDGLPPWTGHTNYRARLRVPRLPLIKGEFTLWAFLADDKGIHIYDRKVLPGAFHVFSESYRFGLVDVAHEWDPGVPEASSIGTFRSNECAHSCRGIGLAHLEWLSSTEDEEPAGSQGSERG